MAQCPLKYAFNWGFVFSLKNVLEIAVFNSPCQCICLNNFHCQHKIESCHIFSNFPPNDQRESENTKANLQLKTQNMSILTCTDVTYLLQLFAATHAKHKHSIQLRQREREREKLFLYRKGITRDTKRWKNDKFIKRKLCNVFLVRGCEKTTCPIPRNRRDRRVCSLSPLITI